MAKTFYKLCRSMQICKGNILGLFRNKGHFHKERIGKFIYLSITFLNPPLSPQRGTLGIVAMIVEEYLKEKAVFKNASLTVPAATCIDMGKRKTITESLFQRMQDLC